MRIDVKREKIYFLDETGIHVHCRTNYEKSNVATRTNHYVKAIHCQKFSICAIVNYKSLYFNETKEYSHDGETFYAYILLLKEYHDRDNITGAYLVMDKVSP